MKSGRLWTVGLLALGLAACGEAGGELRDATERRRAAELEGDTAAPSAAPAAEPAPARLPAFVLDDPAAADSPAAADTPRAPAEPAPALGKWTAGVVDAVRSQQGAVTLTDLRTGVNAGFDRVVMEFTGSSVPGHRIEYIDRPVRECGSGRTVPVAGDGWLAITMRGTRAHTDAGRATIERRNRRVDMPVLRQVVVTCDFEGVVQVVLGVSSPNPFRVTELRDPARLIVDVRQ